MKQQLEVLVNSLYDELQETEVINDEIPYTINELIAFNTMLEKAFPNYVFKFDGVSKWVIVSEL